MSSSGTPGSGTPGSVKPAAKFIGGWVDQATGQVYYRVEYALTSEELRVLGKSARAQGVTVSRVIEEIVNHALDVLANTLGDHAPAHVSTLSGSSLDQSRIRVVVTMVDGDGDSDGDAADDADAANARLAQLAQDEAEVWGGSAPGCRVTPM